MWALTAFGLAARPPLGPQPLQTAVLSEMSQYALSISPVGLREPTADSRALITTVEPLLLGMTAAASTASWIGRFFLIPS